MPPNNNDWLRRASEPWSMVVTKKVDEVRTIFDPLPEIQERPSQVDIRALDYGIYFSLLFHDLAPNRCCSSNASAL